MRQKVAALTRHYDRKDPYRKLSVNIVNDLVFGPFFLEEDINSLDYGLGYLQMIIEFVSLSW